ncbi:MAG: sigma-70 family RNA polymerase sigma factor [Chlorobi bacterium]|nr:sigma-70 family RNA polymerase sigma factor [Chlorobiota bacterium]
MYPNEADIIDGCRRGKHRAQKALYDRYHPVLMGICLRFAKSNAEAEDILLMGLTRIYDKISDYNGSGSFEGWMKRIMINVAIDNYRKNLKHYFHEDFNDLSADATGVDYIPDNFSVGDIIRTIQELPDGYRIVFNLYAIEGYSHKEIAEKLNISESTSKTQLMKARKKLRQKLLLLDSVPEVQPFTEKKNIVEAEKIF